MISDSLIRRRTLRPTGSAALIEGSVSRRRAASNVSVEIVGGPPGAALAIIVAGHGSRILELDSCGFGIVELAVNGAELEVEVRHADQVVLTGRIPSLTVSTRVRR